MFLDDLIRQQKNELKELNKLNPKFVEFHHYNLEDAINHSKDFIDLLEKKVKLFFVDSMVLDSLYNVSHNNPDYKSSIRLPFPFVFFEFEKPLEVICPESQKNYLMAMLFYKDIDRLKESQKIESSHQDYNKHFIEEISKRFKINLFFHNLYPFKHFISFDTHTLPNFIYSDSDKEKIYEYHPKPNSLNTIILDTENGKITQSNDSPTMAKEFYKLLDLTINLINLINAQNVEIVRKKPPEKLDRVTAKRIRKGKKPLVWVPTRPYYMIEVKKEVYEEIEKLDKGDKAWELNYRVWVRGYFYHYKDIKWGEKVGNCRWIPPHIRGPYNAPWKYNRYKVLYKNFRYKLHSRGNESVD